MNHEHELFEAYLHGMLTAEDRRAFETRLRGDDAFAESFREFRSLFQLVHVAGEHRLKAELGSIHDAMRTGIGGKQDPRVISMRPWSWLAIAASLLLAIGTAYFFLDQSQSPQELFAEHMAPYTGPDRMRSDGVDAADPWLLFADQYDAQRYDEALAELANVPNEKVPAYLVAFYRGQCLLLKNPPDPGAAIASLVQVLATDNDLHAHAQWYIGLAALKANDLLLARTHFEAVKAGNGFMHNEAAGILEQLSDH